VGGRWWGGTGYPLYRPFEPQSSGLRQQNSVDAVGGRWWVGTGYPLTQKPTLSTGPLKLNLQSLRPQTAKLSQLALFVQLAHWSVVNVWIFDELRLACSRHCCDTVYVKQLTCFTVCSENCCTCGIVSYQDVNRVFCAESSIVICFQYTHTHTLHMWSSHYGLFTTQPPSVRDAFFTENFILHHEIFTFYWDSMKFSTFPSIKIKETGVSLGWHSL